MNQLLNISEQKSSAITMSSREIAVLIQKNHSDLCRSIGRLIEKQVIKGYQPTAYTHPQNGQSYYEYHLAKRDCLIVVAQNCPEFTAAIVDRWQELENQQAVKLPQSFAEALRLAADLEEEKQALLLENQQQLAQIESMESYFRNGISAPQFAKGLNGVNSHQINEHLHQVRWLYKDAKNQWRVSSYARDRYMTEQPVPVLNHGKEQLMTYKPVLLQKGAAKIYEWYTQGKLTMKANWNGEFTQDKVVGL
ncbi:Rha family transcriptional regulator [Actinobacillus pleuropneumoniae]|uniref:Rha family transcriptional regulator n=1 Tax=Actinobacillus pleuropneumoniae TaxID=715 RepID=UPI0001E4A243|nr:Rha family transcriptional regulator [Actinobacillus pleuropneumoniae]EFM88778.1 hypothetical protein appser4_20900 [Actinobacillus pleuropneumoniae serovar 4 str. M62]MCY6396654.1 Rha family transcriptional regulator [Actinobacillus pleuropneumoniae]MCY6410454.1 Rha family transcriptional regulator [Actinobacillus pleuropneumoniae]MCY6428831.1 Rha family transcriptional regulator [Actinobacillus pleuropneumoniae]UKH38585.1 phage regulatory protein [Actinobacillus pleuropneumoniae]